MESVFLIAGEASGDALGASLMKGLKAQGVSSDAIAGIGGGLMCSEGMDSLIPMEELCVMGIWEILWQIPRLIRLIHGVVEEIEQRQPDMVVTIDLPDFNFRVAEKLKKRGIYKGKIVHYVAPTVWAWRPGRAEKVAGYLDGMMCLFPFEPAYFEKHGLKAAYVGHPLIEFDRSNADGGKFRADRGIGADDLCVGLMLGSRAREVDVHAPVFLQTLDALEEQYPGLNVIIPTLPALEYDVSKHLDGRQLSVHIVTDQGHKYDAFDACDIALAVSGTVGLELGYLGVPHITGYKAHALTAAILKLVVRVRYAHLVNILLDRQVVPEFLQGKCNVSRLTRGFMRLLRCPEDVQAQKMGFVELQQKLTLEEGKPPSHKAASFVLNIAK